MSTAAPHIVESAGGLIINDRGDVVLVKQLNIHIPWSLPKGHVEAGEDFLTAARREIYEETGLTELELIKELPVYERYPTKKNGTPDTNIVKRLHFFLFKTSHVELKPIDPANPEARWVPKEKVLEYFTHEKDREFFSSVMNEW